jgi:hypothetical protein
MQEPNPLDIILRILGAVALAVGITVGAVSVPADAPDASAAPPISVTRDPLAGGDMTGNPVPHVIESVEAFILESMPPQISLGVIGYQPDGCNFPVQVAQSRQGNSITVNIYREVPPGMMCTMQVIAYQNTILLEGTFDPGTYTITVNGITITATV